MFSKGRSLAAAFSGVRHTGMYLFCHGNWERLEWFLWTVPNVGDVKLGKSPNIQALYHAVYIFHRNYFFLLQYIIIKWQSNDS